MINLLLFQEFNKNISNMDIESLQEKFKLYGCYSHIKYANKKLDLIISKLKNDCDAHIIEPYYDSFSGEERKVIVEYPNFSYIYWIHTCSLDSDISMLGI